VVMRLTVAWCSCGLPCGWSILQFLIMLTSGSGSIVQLSQSYFRSNVKTDPEGDGLYL